jgi:hypothetical protein
MTLLVHVVAYNVLLQSSGYQRKEWLWIIRCADIKLTDVLNTRWFKYDRD